MLFVSTWLKQFFLNILPPRVEPTLASSWLGAENHASEENSDTCCRLVHNKAQTAKGRTVGLHRREREQDVDPRSMLMLGSPLNSQAQSAAGPGTHGATN